MNDIDKLQSMIDECNNIVFFGGAGVSTESGIKDFRGKDGIYKENPEYMLSSTCFYEETDKFYKFYKDKMNCLSANNGVPQIRNTLNIISKKYGKRVVFRNKNYYLFPGVEKLKDVKVEDYRNCKAGFRDKYIYEIVNKINNKEFDIDSIDNMNSEDALNYLMNNKGIGEKVASCILLFGYHRFDVFPIDTWVKKYMKEKHNLDSVKAIREYMKNKYNDNCGLVIQYIFHYNRNKSDRYE